MAKNRKRRSAGSRKRTMGVGAGLAEWKSLYRTANEFIARRPWEYLENNDIFFVHDPDTADLFLCGVMGAAGSEFGLNAFRGAAGFRSFFTMMESDRAVPHREFRYHIDMLSFSQSERDLLSAADFAITKKLLLTYRGGEWPLFRSYRPHFMPGMLDIGEARSLRRCLEQAMWVADTFGADAPEHLRSVDNGNKVLVRSLEDGEWKTHFTGIVYPEDPVPALDLDDISRERLSAMPRAKQWLELDLVHMPIPIADRDPPWFPLAVVASDHEGIVSSEDMLSPLEDGLYERALASTVSVLTERPACPATVRLREGPYAELVGPLLEEVGVRCEVFEDLAGIEEFMEATEEHFRQGESS